MEKKTFDVLLEESKSDAFFKTFGFFKNKFGEIGIAYVKEYPRKFISIITYNEEGEKTGFIDIFVHPSRFYLSEIYCFKKFRGTGIADNLVLLADYLLKDYVGVIMRGVLMPHDSVLDDTAISQDICSRNARVEAFYRKSGFDIVKRKEYLANSSKYPLIDYNIDFLKYEEIPDVIIIKQITGNSSYIKKNGLLFASNALDREPDVMNYLSVKNFVMTPVFDESDKY